MFVACIISFYLVATAFVDSVENLVKMEHTEYVQVVSEEWRTDGGSGWVTPVVLVTGASPEFRAELLSRPERGGRHDPATDIIRFKKFSHMDVRFHYICTVFVGFDFIAAYTYIHTS